MQLDDDDLLSILEDHNSRSKHFGEMENPDVLATGYNPVCGDRYQVHVRLRKGRIVDILFNGFGCVISRASASIMAETLKGLTRDEAASRISEVHAILTDGGELPEYLHQDLVALLGVRRFPGRIKCVTLGWHTARAALDGELTATTE
jgi:nitrogen fixation NifU-like protein